MSAQIVYILMQYSRGEAFEHVRQHELDGNSGGHGMTVGKMLATLECQRLEGVSCRMPEVEGTAYTLLHRVFGDDALLDAHTFLKQPEQRVRVTRHGIEGKELGKFTGTAQQSVL